MSNYDLAKINVLFARLFVLAIQNKINPSSFIYMLERSEFLIKIERGKYDEYFNKPLIDIFFDITNFELQTDTSFGIYNDAYWCGDVYFKLFLKNTWFFSYIFLKLPFEKLLDLYSIYHEMDFSEMQEQFLKLEQEKTILRVLCEQKRVSLEQVSKSTGLNIATLKKYNASDNAIFNASFLAVSRIVNYFDIPYSMFIAKKQNI